MKVVAILSVVFVLVQVGKSDSSQLALEISETVTECRTKQKLDKKTISTLMNELVVAEDNEGVAEFFACLATTLGVMDGNGDVVEGRAAEVLQEMLRQKFGSIPDANTNAEHLIEEALQKCKDTPKGDSVGQSAIKMRNCIKAEVQKTQTH